MPLSELEQKWVFPQEGFEDVELSMIDADGDYIIKGHSFKNSSFFYHLYCSLCRMLHLITNISDMLLLHIQIFLQIRKLCLYILAGVLE